jgi:hypothetical protein
MNADTRKQLYENLDLKETGELVEIWQANNHTEWTDLEFDVLREILLTRLDELSQQGEPIYEKLEANQQQKRFWQPILIIPAVMLAFILLAILGNLIYTLNQNWVKLPPPPVKVKELVTTDIMLYPSSFVDLIILAEDKQMYRYDPQTAWKNSVWKKNEILAISFRYDSYPGRSLFLNPSSAWKINLILTPIFFKGLRIPMSWTKMVLSGCGTIVRIYFAFSQPAL